MRAAVDGCVPGVVGDCGGNLSCATCHCYIGEPWRSRLALPTEDELGMLDCATAVTEESRLTCQIEVMPDFEGLVIRVPEQD